MDPNTFERFQAVIHAGPRGGTTGTVHEVKTFERSEHLVGTFCGGWFSTPDAPHIRPKLDKTARHTDQEPNCKRCDGSH